MRWPLLLTAVAAALGSAAATQTLSLCDAGTALTPIAEIQGRERRSPLLDQGVTVEGIVTTAFLGAGTLGGVFIQMANGDGDLATSDALFVRLLSRSPFTELGFRPGDLLRARGVVKETGSQTTLDRVEALERCANVDPIPPTEITFPLLDADIWEAHEGMLVEIRGPLTVTEVYNLGRYGEVSVADTRLYHPNNGQPAEANALRRIIINDGSRLQNPTEVPFLVEGGVPRVGDRVDGLLGILVNDGFDAYRLEPLVPPSFTRAVPRPERPDAVGGRLRVAAVNVLNFFTTLGDRGADTPEELMRQRDKLVSALQTLDADVLALVEVENNDTEAASALVNALNRVEGTDTYVFMSDPATGVGGDRIKQVILYRPAVLELIGSTSAVKSIFERAPVAATFRERASGEVFTLVAVHFRSKGGCPTAGDTDEGYGCWNLRRSAQAQTVVDFAAQLVRDTDDPDVLVLGDFNSYRQEPPLRIFEAAGYISLDDRLPPESRYSYVFFGEAGTLDYALASPSLNRQTAGFTIWHINADEPPALDYNTEFNPAWLYTPDPFRSSDHDPLLLGLDLGSE